MSDTDGLLRYAEYTVHRKAQGRFFALRLALLAGYGLFGLGYCVLFFAVLPIPQVVAVLPVLEWILIYFTWGVTSYDLSVCLQDGELRVTVLAGKRRKTVECCRATALVAAGPCPAELPAGTRDWRGDRHSPDGWLFTLPQGSFAVEVTAKLVQAVAYYNPICKADTSMLRH